MPSRQVAITDQQRRFAQELLFDMDPYAAAKRAGYPHGSDGPKLLAYPAVVAEIRYLKERQASRTEVTADAILKRWWLLATADANELVQLRRVNCRYCYGTNHEYQRTPAEMNRALEDHQIAAEKAKDKGKSFPPFNEQGGEGFNRWAQPHPDCPECAGEGEPQPYYVDSRNLSPAGKALYAGVEVTASGAPKLRMRDQEAALLNVAKHLGMHIDRKEVTGPNGEPLEILVRVVKPQLELEGTRNLVPSISDAVVED